MFPVLSAFAFQFNRFTQTARPYHKVPYRHAAELPQHFIKRDIQMIEMNNFNFNDKRFLYEQYFSGVLKIFEEILNKHPNANEILQNIHEICFDSFSKKETVNARYIQILKDITYQALSKNELGVLLHILENLRSNQIRIPKQKPNNHLDVGLVDLIIYHLKAFRTSNLLTENLANYIEIQLNEKHGFLNTTTVEELKELTKALIDTVEQS